MLQGSLSRPHKASYGQGRECENHWNDLYSHRCILSNFPSCDCQQSFEGNFCKHQNKALLDREHKPRLIFSRLGTRLGSKYARLLPPTSTVVTPHSTLPPKFGCTSEGNLKLPDLNMLSTTLYKPLQEPPYSCPPLWSHISRIPLVVL
jgi:hypothetical protein